MNPLGRQVKSLREGKSWTQVQLAVRADLSPTVVNQVETGKRKPSIDTVEKLAEALGAEVADLFRGYQLPKAQASSSTAKAGAPKERRTLEEPSWPRWPGAESMLPYYARKFSEFEERAASIEAGESVPGGPLELFFDVEKETAAADASIGRLYPDEVTRLMKRGLPIMESMFENYRAQKLRMEQRVDEALEEVLERRLAEKRLKAAI